MDDKITLAIGIDIGGHIKFYSGDIKLEISNIIGNSNPVAWSEMAIDKRWKNNLILIEGDQEYYIGELARTQSSIKRYVLEKAILTKISDVFFLIKAALPLIAKVEDEIVLGIGVPIATSEETLKELSSKLKGEVEVKIKNEATKEIIERKFNIKQVLLMPESYGTYYDILTTIGEENVIDALVITLDLHTEIVTIYDGNLVRLASRNIADASLSVLTNKVARALEEDTGSIVNPHSILESIRNNDTQVVIAGKIANISSVKDYYIRQISAEIVENVIEVLNLLPLDNTVEYFIITGEACDIFWNELEMLLIENLLIKDVDVDRIIKVPNPIFSNAKGFEAMVKRKLTLSE